MARSPVSPRVFGIERLAHRWAELDPWWRGHVESSPVASESASVRVLGLEQLNHGWDDLAPWWNVYTETGHDTAVAVSELLEQSNAGWEASGAPFDTDPLAADLTGERFLRGPLRPSGEVAWSRWLARLLRPSPALGTELFDVPGEQAPNEVVREVQLSKRDGSFRRPDVLVCYDDLGVSIEVKLGDENYRKTAETARLVERHYDDREWVHALLLPKRRKNRLEALVEPPLTRGQDDRLRVMWADPGPVDVIHWRDVTAAIRSLLRRGEVPDEHWAANAYLFCAVAEQQLVDFQPQPVIERLAKPANVVDTIQPIGIADTLEEQLTYLRERRGP